jgi:nitroreductase
MKTSRVPKYPISELILNRWSPRAMSSEALTDKELMTLFEAARWAPSSFNEQPWRFIYAKRDTPNWDKFFNLLMEGNQSWCKNASVLVCAISKKNFTQTNKPHRTHMFSTGSAYENLALQASTSGLVCHGMGGFFADKAKTELNIPDDFEVNMMFAIGKPADKSVLPKKLQEVEVPSDRKPLEELIFEGEFISSN